jgi:hypothetical protein
MQVSIAHDRWLRSWTRTLGFGVALMLYGAFFVWLAFHHHERAADGVEYTNVVILTMMLVLAAPGVVLGFRQLRSGLWVDSEKVIVRGMFRTARLSPDEVDGFKAERVRTFIGPVLHCKHRAPLVVGGLGCGGISAKGEAYWLQASEGVCDQLNSLLESVRSAQADRAPAELGLRPSDQQAAYAHQRRLHIVFSTGVVGMCLAIALLVPSATAIGFATVAALAQLAGVFLSLRKARQDLNGG